MDSPPSTIENQTPKEKPVVITSDGSKKSIFKYSLVNPKFLGAMTVLLLMIGGIGAGVYLTQKPQQTITQATLSPVSVNFQPDAIESLTGSEFSVDIFAIAGENKITGADLSIKYDPKILSLKSITPKSFLPNIVIPPKIASGSATISLGTQGTEGISGSGILASLLFDVATQSAQTSTSISFEQGKTQIKLLNRSEGGSDTFGDALVNIKLSPKPSPIIPIPTASASAQITPAELSDLNNDGLINSIDRSLMRNQSQ